MEARFTRFEETDDVEGDSGFAIRLQAEERQRDVLRHALDRARLAAEHSSQKYRQWQESTRELLLLRAYLAVVDPELVDIKKSAAYRFALRIRRIRLFVAPAGSLRERLGEGVVRGACRVGQFFDGVCRLFGKRSCVVDGRGSVESVPSPSTAGLPPPASGDAAAQRDSGDKKPPAPPPTDVAELAYSPLSWELKEESPADARFIDLIILSANHRAGSTLLQRICNARKGTLIWGEQGGLLASFADIYTHAAQFSLVGSQERLDYFNQGENPNLWIANMSPELDYVRQAVVNSARTFLNTLYRQYRDQHDILGFKEVQYDRAEIELLRRCYPQAHLLLLVRNPLNTWNSTSRDWYSSLDEWVEKWNRSVRCFQSFAASDPRCHLIRYEDLIQQETKTMATLAEAAKVSPEQVAMVLSHKIGSNDLGVNVTEKDAILTRCREPMEALGYL